MRFGWAVILWVAALLLTGCGSGDQMDIYPVQGKVMFNGSPAEGATVVFLGTTEELRGKKAPIPTGKVQSDGTFRLTSYEPDDGAPAGEYRVAITWFEELPEGVDPESFDPKDKMGGKYDAVNSELMARVPEEAVEIPTFDLK